MRLEELVTTSDRVRETASRRQKVGRLAELLARCPPEEVEGAIAFLSGVLPQGRIGVGPAALRAARPARPAAAASLTVGEVAATLQRIAAAEGPGSTAEKQRLLRRLLARATEAEASLLLRLLLGELRQGALESSMVEALAPAASLPASQLRRAVMISGELAAVARAVLAEGEAGLRRFGIRLFRPVQPMLAQTSRDVGAALERLGEAALESKLDGARLQIHKAGDEVRLFSRGLREVTSALPEVAAAVRALPFGEAILDGEVLALRPDGSPHPFQVTMSRFGRKFDVERRRSELPVTPFLFDCLYLEGEDLTGEPQQRRFAELVAAVPPSLVIPHRRTADPEEARAFVDAVLAQGHEGVMAKSPEEPYRAGSRGAAWLKVKPAHTLDLVVLAAEWGHGRRRGWLSNLHLGARDPAAGGFVMLGKTFKGMTDATLSWQTERLLELEIGRDGHTVFVRPELVAEVAFNDLQESPHYPGRLALRFARLKRYREDKRPDEADTLATVRELYLKTTGRAAPPV